MTWPNLPECGEEPTRRERQIVKRLALGHTNVEIGKHFGISEYAIKSHLARISAKLGVEGRNAVVAAAFEEEWLYLPEALILVQAERILRRKWLEKVRGDPSRQAATSERAA